MQPWLDDDDVIKIADQIARVPQDIICLAVMIFRFIYTKLQDKKASSRFGVLERMHNLLLANGFVLTDDLRFNNPGHPCIHLVELHLQSVGFVVCGEVLGYAYWQDKLPYTEEAFEFLKTLILQPEEIVKLIRRIELEIKIKKGEKNDWPRKS